MKYLIGLKETSEAIKRFALFLTTLVDPETNFHNHSKYYVSITDNSRWKNGRLSWINHLLAYIVWESFVIYRYTYILESELLFFSVLLLVSVLYRKRRRTCFLVLPSHLQDNTTYGLSCFFSGISGEIKILSLRIISIRKIGHVRCYPLLLADLILVIFSLYFAWCYSNCCRSHEVNIYISLSLS